MAISTKEKCVAAVQACARLVNDRRYGRISEVAFEREFPIREAIANDYREQLGMGAQAVKPVFEYTAE